MQTVPSGGRLANPALRQGLIFGVILGILQVIYSFVANFVNLGSISTVIVFGLYLVLPLVAALRSTPQTGRLTTGLLTGLLAGFLGSFINALVAFVSALINIDAVVQSTIAAAKSQNVKDTSVYTPNLILTVLAVTLLFIIVLASLVGLAGGALGGVIGRNRAQTPAQEYEESMFVQPAATSERSESSEVPPAP